MRVDIWMMFCLAYLVITLSPGPNVLLVLKNSVQYGWKSAFITVCGNLCCQLLIVCLVAIGVGELLKQLPVWFTVMKIIGGGYLIYLGIKNLLALRRVKSGLLQNSQPEKRKGKTPHQLFREAFLVSASNPKTMIFLSAFLPQFLDISHPHVEQFAVMYLSICMIVLTVHLGYAFLISRIGKKLLNSRFERRLSAITGGLFISMGGGVLFSSRV